MINDKFVFIGILLQLYGSWSYLIDTLKGRVQPNKVTWFLWSIAPLIAAFAMFKQGVGVQVWVTFIVGFVPLVIFIASFFNKKAHWKISKFDIACGVLSFVGLLLWVITKEGNIAILFSILSDGLAALPTILKSYTDPDSESPTIFLCGTINALLGILTIKTWNFQTYAFPMYLLFMDTLIGLLIISKVGLRNKHYVHK